MKLISAFICIAVAALALIGTFLVSTLPGLFASATNFQWQVNPRSIIQTRRMGLA